MKERKKRVLRDEGGQNSVGDAHQVDVDRPAGAAEISGAVKRFMRGDEMVREGYPQTYIVARISNNMSIHYEAQGTLHFFPNNGSFLEGRCATPRATRIDGEFS